MHIEEGRVEITDEGFALVAAKAGYACMTCPLVESCKTLGADGEMIIKAINYVGAKVGDKVVVAVGSKVFFKFSTFKYLLPFAAFIVGAAFGRSIAPHLGLNIHAVGVSAIFGSISLVNSLFAMSLIGRGIEVDKGRARVIRVLHT